MKTTNDTDVPREDDGADTPTPEVPRGWTFFTNHAHVLLCLRQDPDARMRDLAERIGITERAVQKILHHLEEEGLVDRHREGRRNTYELHLDTPLPHPLESHRDVGSLIDMMLPDDLRPSRRRATRRRNP